MDRPDPLRGLIQCVCGPTIRACGFMGGKPRRVHSVQPCPEGVTKKIWDSETWLAPLEAQIAGLQIDDRTTAAVVAALSQSDRPMVPIDRGRLERRRQQLALDVAGGHIEEREFLAAMRRLKEEEAASALEPRTNRPVDAARAIEYIQNFASAWAKAKPPTRATMMQAVYEARSS